ncbi:MAG: hypothetical protein ACR2GQ_09155 [Gemmatimonadota bacterium]
MLGVPLESVGIVGGPVAMFVWIPMFVLEPVAEMADDREGPEDRVLLLWNRS